jgi:hypothetical protein
MKSSEAGGGRGGYLGGPGLDSAAGFPPPPMPLMGRRHEQPLPQEEEHDNLLAMTYDRALDCVNNFGMCDIDELLDLSEELDEYMDSCYVEDGPEACENEIGVSFVICIISSRVYNSCSLHVLSLNALTTILYVVILSSSSP